MYAGRIAAATGVTKSTLMEQVKMVDRRRARKQQRQMLSQAVREGTAELKKVNPEADKHLRAAKAEEALLGTLMRNPDFIPKVAETLSPEQMVTSFNVTLYRQLLARHQGGLMVEPSLLAADYEVEGVAYITRMMQQAGERDNSLEDAMACARVIRQEHDKLKMGKDASPEDIRTYLKKLKESKK